MYIDLHCHVLPAIDDGAKDMNVALEMCKIAVEDGIKHIIATPHYICSDLENKAHVVKQSISILQSALQENNIELSVYPGCEAFISPEIPELVRKGEVCTLNDTFYVLLELPLMSIPDYTEEVIYQLRINGYTPIIAHPERNQVIGRHPKILERLIELGALTQMNATSLRGTYGKRIKKIAIKFLKNDMIHLVSSDAHTARYRVPKLSETQEAMEKIIGKEKTLQIFSNAEAVLKGQEICIHEIKRKRKVNISSQVHNLAKKVIALLS